jgi:hypothetical protein
LEGWKEEALKKAILTKDGLEAFKRILASKVPLVIVSPEDLLSLLKQSNQPPHLVSNGAAACKPTAENRTGVTDRPQNEVEQLVADVWSSVLGIGPIGIHENFVDLGGHSLLALQIISKIRTAYRINFTLRDFFEGPTIAGVSVAIKAAIVAEIERMGDDEVKRLISVD